MPDWFDRIRPQKTRWTTTVALVQKKDTPPADAGGVLILDGFQANNENHTVVTLAFRRFLIQPSPPKLARLEHKSTRLPGTGAAA